MGIQGFCVCGVVVWLCRVEGLCLSGEVVWGAGSGRL